ncbi:hypothetical protein CEB3_c00970 [Peptococcaceae bacterium CEB3]|nr:hypothetical protein CEB3_c00970 [Peptococcaceae bacterium CEB3]
MIKKRFLSSIIILSLALFFYGCAPKIQQQGQKSLAPQSAQSMRNEKYPDIVAEVGNYKITGSQLRREIAVKRNAYVNVIKKPQENSFYEKVALGLLITNALVNNEVKKKGFSVSTEEAKLYLQHQEKAMNALPDIDPAKTVYDKMVRGNGYSSAIDYVNSPEVIKVTQIILGRQKLRNSIEQSVLQGQNGAYKAWEDYTDKLISEGNYKVLIPVNVKGIGS